MTFAEALAAAREATIKQPGVAHERADYLGRALRDLIAALDAAQGEAVAGSVQSGSVTIPFWVIDYAQKIELFMRVNGVDAWAIGGIQSRDLPPPQAPPAPAVPAGYVPLSVLVEAREGIEEWGAYASPYHQQKHDLAGVLARIDAVLAAAQGVNRE